MSVANLAMIVFFIIFGVASFWGFPYANIVEGIAAIVAGVALALGK